MLKKETIQKINELVHAKPRSISEVAKHIDVNWRTASRYVEKISKEEGTISVRVFRGGTPGALKIVFWNTMEQVNASEIQDRLFKQIESGRRKEEFSASEIFQFVDEKKKKMEVLNRKEYYSEPRCKNFMDELKQVNRQVLFFSGNMTFTTYKHKNKKILNVLEELGKRKISMKVLTRVETPGIKNVQNSIEMNKRLGHDAIEIRHCFQPLRITIFDDNLAVTKEVLDPKNYSKGELKEKLYILYYIYDQDWIEWLQKVFWYLFRGSIDARKRMEELDLIM